MREAKRIRRSKAASRQAILAAAEELMLAEGPAAVRVQRVAAAVGITDAAVHYHFGNREGLLEALLRHSGRALVRDVAAAAGPDGEPDLPAVSHAMRDTYGPGGAARMMMWLALSGWRPQGEGMYAPLLARVHARRPAGADPRETAYLIALLNAAHASQAILGEALMRSVSQPSDEAGQQAFLDWVTALVETRLALAAPPPQGEAARSAEGSETPGPRASTPPSASADTSA